MTPEKFTKMRTILKRLSENCNELNKLSDSITGRDKKIVEDAEQSLIQSIDILKDLEEAWL